MNKKMLFISDLHLDEHHSKTTDLFMSFLNQLDDSVEALYILGDFFNVWVGDDDISLFHTKIQAELKKISMRCPIYFLPGNRDFLIGKQFAKNTGCILLKDPSVVKLYGVPTLLMHGDLLCTYDRSHLQFRAISQNAWIKYFFLKLPLSVRKKIAQKLRQKSRQHLANVPNKLWDIDEVEVRRVMNKYGVNQMIHGHIHKPIVCSVDLGDKKGQRIVLGDWNDKGGSVLICEANVKDSGLTKNALGSVEFRYGETEIVYFRAS